MIKVPPLHPPRDSGEKEFLKKREIILQINKLRKLARGRTVQSPDLSVSNRSLLLT